MRTRSRRPLQRCRIQKLQRPPNGDSFPAARSAVSYPRQIVAANWARSARCCVAKGSTHRNWLPGVSSASPSNAVLEPKKRGRKADPVLAEARQVAELTKENDRLRHQLAQAHIIIDVQKKLCTLLGLPTAADQGEHS